jgi:hypothetical protein
MRALARSSARTRPQLRPLAVRRGRFRSSRARVLLLDLPAELLVAIVALLLEDDELATLLACRRLREAVAATNSRQA